MHTDTLSAILNLLTLAWALLLLCCGGVGLLMALAEYIATQAKANTVKDMSVPVYSALCVLLGMFTTIITVVNMLSANHA